MSSVKPIRKAVFPVAGFGTRFLPATKANPKEMLPIVDKPLIQYAVEEAVAAGMTHMIFVTSSSKRAIEDHFDMNYELESRLEQKGAHALLEIVRNILPKGISCTYVRQPEQLGLGHAVACARSVIGSDPFAVILADDLIQAEPNCLQQMCAIHEATGANVLAVEEVPYADTYQYGIVATTQKNDGWQHITNLVEKPRVTEAPSRLAVVGRYVLNPEIFDRLAQIPAGRGGEIQLTDAIAQLLHTQSCIALPFQGTRFDCGTKLGYLQATVAYALTHPELAHAFRDYLHQHIDSDTPLIS